MAPRPTPTATYWLCERCVATAPDAFALGYADRPLLYYTNAKPWGPAKRTAWTLSQNAATLLAFALIDAAAAPLL